MSPEVVAAIIAGSVGILTLAGTVAAQILGFRSTRADTERQIKATHGDTADTLRQHREQFEKTLEAQRDQLRQTLGEQSTQTLNERFATAAGQLGSDKPPAVRLAGVYAMAGLADDWKANRQTCVDVLCGYLRLPYETDPGNDAPMPQMLAFLADREVRHTVIRVITAHLVASAKIPWQGLNFDFTGTVFDAGSFGEAIFSGGTVNFSFATFWGGLIDFRSAKFSGATVDFSFARFAGGEVCFSSAEFSGGTVSFGNAVFSAGGIDFTSAKFAGSEVYFNSAQFSGAAVNFSNATFSGGLPCFTKRSGFTGGVYFDSAQFSSGIVDFGNAVFSPGPVDFSFAKFAGATVNFGHVPIDGSGGKVTVGSLAASFGLPVGDAKFSGGTIDFSNAADWSHPPTFPWANTPAPGVMLPHSADQS